MPEPSQDELAAFDELEAQHSQRSPSKPQRYRSPVHAELDDADNPFIAPRPPNKSSTVPAFISASRVATTSSSVHERSPSPGLPEEKDYSGWFQPMDYDSIPGFQSAAFATASEELPPTIGFMKASDKKIIAPSKDAYLKAQQKLDAFWSEDVDGDEDDATSPPLQALTSTFQSASTLKETSRPALKAMENSAAFNTGLHTPLREVMPQDAPESPPRISSTLKGKSKAFVSPLISSAQKPEPAPAVGSKASPFVKSSMLASAASSGVALPQAQKQPFSSPLLNRDKRSAFKSPLPATPSRPIGLAIQRNIGTRKTPASFKTPFKHHALVSSVVASPSPMPRKPSRAVFFDLSKPPNRQKVHEVFSPQSSRSVDDVPADLTELAQITPELAIYYSFHSNSTESLLGTAAAFDHLTNLGCTLATKDWVDNHWSLILWKLAGLALQDIDHGQDPRKRWCWGEVIRQMLYRYERELNSGTRPLFRLITTQDMPPSFPMVLCISRITWIDGNATEGADKSKTLAYPELEVTDGWYKLRAQVDAALARAVRRGIIRVGRKIFVAGARLSSDRKDPSEVLEAYNSTKLIISGNSSHLAPWHARLGYHKGVSDGGPVAAMDLVITKAHPVAFLEFFEKDGKKWSEGPHNAVEESKFDRQWQKERDDHISKLQAEVEKKWHRYHGYMERLQQKAGNRFRPGQDDYPPDCIDDLYTELELPETASATLTRIPPNHAGWLAQHIAKQLEIEKERSSDNMEQELKVGQRYIVTNLTPTQQKAWMGNVPGSEVYLATRRDSKWIRLK
ncbi:hypothetical protein BDN72DRAFT_852512 [Pluteus cervinus]|uniref:Uncharacterized protein n=1 Tax=Pluteus cervinus TaxID=181527 RepID=A0ACD3BI83_9AGAR|nr:hypothetical protein BDN72DRAFT_852512 [Pluteus cervinus]